MSIAAEIIVTARESGVELLLDGDRLRVRGPSDAITPDTIAALKAHKAEVMALLIARQEPQPDETPAAPVQEIEEDVQIPHAPATLEPAPPPAIDPPQAVAPIAPVDTDTADADTAMQVAFNALAQNQPPWSIQPYTLSLRSGIPAITCRAWLKDHRPPRPDVIPAPPPRPQIPRAELIAITAKSIRAQRPDLPEVDALAMASRLIDGRAA